VTTMQLCAGLGAAVGALALRIGGSFDVSLEHAFSIAFLILAGICLVAAAMALRLDRSAGDVLRSRHRPGPPKAEEATG
jgi:hypothetical protein